MSITSKLLTSLLLLLTILGGGIWLIERTLVIPGIEALERSELEAELAQADAAIARELEEIHRWTVDWGHWDETYAYVQGQNPGFVAANLAEGTLDELVMDLLLITTADGPLLLQTSARLNGTPAALARRLDDALAADARGFVSLDEDLLMVAASPVIRTDGSGAPMGTLYFGRLTTPRLVQALEQAVSHRVSLHPDPRPAQPGQILLPASNVSISRLWRPVHGEGPQSLRIEWRGARPFLNRVLTSTYQLMGLIFVLGLLATLATYGLLRRQLIRPILQLKQAVDRFSRSHVPEALTMGSRRDELGALARAFRQMAYQLQADRKSLLSEREQLKQDSLTDPLTGLGNRRFLDECLTHWRLRESIHFILVMIIDIDHFKRINDQHGHDIGDRVLQEFAQLLKRCCRSEDLLVRSGGEEFIAVCELATEDDAPVIAERIREQAAHEVFAGGAVRLSGSIGFIVAPIATTAPVDGCWPQLFKVADMALYQAKQAGRNRWVGWRAGEPTAPLPESAAELHQALAQQSLQPVKP